ncbi:MAG: hypothetical protein O3A00_06930 [Planctomycetota bacterium]|nr:hypothetical protein [Planctomycetota bacterium]
MTGPQHKELKRTKSRAWTTQKLEDTFGLREVRRATVLTERLDAPNKAQV